MKRTPRLFVCIILLSACKDEASRPQPMFHAPQVGIALPKLAGWHADPTAKIEDSAKGGVVLRLIRNNQVALSPRIDVFVEPVATQPTCLEDFLRKNLKDMATFEDGGSIHITDVEQSKVRIGSRPGYRVRHEYSMSLDKNTTPIAITQLSTLLIVDGRGVAITAPGRTELFLPLADSIEQIMAGMTISESSTKPVADPTPEGRPRPPGLPSGIQPTDLGKVGGK